MSYSRTSPTRASRLPLSPLRPPDELVGNLRARHLNEFSGCVGFFKRRIAQAKLAAAASGDRPPSSLISLKTLPASVKSAFTSWRASTESRRALQGHYLLDAVAFCIPDPISTYPWILQDRSIFASDDPGTRRPSAADDFASILSMTGSGTCLSTTGPPVYCAPSRSRTAAGGKEQ